MIASLEAHGMKVNSVKNPAEFRQAVTPVYEKFRKTPAGGLLDKVLAEVK